MQQSAKNWKFLHIDKQKNQLMDYAWNGFTGESPTDRERETTNS